MTLIELHILSYKFYLESMSSPHLMAEVPTSVSYRFHQSRSRIQYRQWRLDKPDRAPLSSRLSTPLRSHPYPSRNSIRSLEHRSNVPTMKKIYIFHVMAHRTFLTNASKRENKKEKLELYYLMLVKMRIT